MCLVGEGGVMYLGSGHVPCPGGRGDVSGEWPCALLGREG